MTDRKFMPIPASSVRVTDGALRAVLEPVRDMVQRRFQGAVKGDRAVTRNDLVELGLVTQRDIDNLKD